MILYHGTNIDIQDIDMSQSKIGKDFGVGFYLTPDYDVAVRQAYRRTDIENGSPTVIVYEYDEQMAAQLKVLSFDIYSREWAEFVKTNRDNRTREQLHDYDIVIGPIANDDIGMQMRKFKAGRIDIDEFLEGIKYKKVTVQYFLGTVDALATLTKTGVKKV